MNTDEARDILGIEPGASEEELTAAFRKKAAKLHPDVNKADSAEEEFKRLNEAYQFLKKYGTDDISAFRSFHVNFTHGGMTGDLGDFFQSFFGNAHRGQTVVQQQIKGLLQVDFEESIIGATKTASYERSVCCPDCSGSGSVNQTSSRECVNCGGKGKRTYGANDKELPCRNCKGSGRVQDATPCSKCIGTGRLRKIENLEVTVPAGVMPGYRIKVPGKGDYSTRYKTYGDALFTLHIAPDRELSREGNDVVSVIDIDLIDALKGVNKKVRTVRGEKTLKIQKGAKHKDTIRVNGFGVPPHGGHRFVLDVKYPDDLDPLIRALENVERDEPEIITGEKQ